MQQQMGAVATAAGQVAVLQDDAEGSDKENAAAEAALAAGRGAGGLAAAKAVTAVSSAGGVVQAHGSDCCLLFSTTCTPCHVCVHAHRWCTVPLWAWWAFSLFDSL